MCNISLFTFATAPKHQTDPEMAECLPNDHSWLEQDKALSYLYLIELQTLHSSTKLVSALYQCNCSTKLGGRQTRSLVHVAEFLKLMVCKTFSSLIWADRTHWEFTRLVLARYMLWVKIADGSLMAIKHKNPNPRHDINSYLSFAFFLFTQYT